MFDFLCFRSPKPGLGGEDSFEVRGTKKDDGTYAIRDGYFGIYIKPEYEAVLSSFVSEIFDEFKLYTDLGEGVLPDRLNKDTKIELDESQLLILNNLPYLIYPKGAFDSNKRNVEEVVNCKSTL